MINPVWNRTKIVATMGPACADYPVLLDMVKSGLDICRLNASHGDHATHQHFIDHVRRINVVHDLNVGILLDLQGPKIRVGKLDKPHPVQAGDIIQLSTTITRQQGNMLPMEYETLAQDVKVGDLILVDDGKVQLEVTETNEKDTVTLKVLVGHEIGSRKGVNLPFSNVSLPSLTEKDIADVELAVANQLEWVALSFVRKASDITALRQLLQARNCPSRIVAKIEKPEALRNIDEIIDASDAIMVARGDLGVEIYMEEVPMWQKVIVRKCNEKAKPVIVATQMLESMIENPRPTRAETTDVANAVMDGADAVMLSGETSVGKYPLEVVRVMQRIITIVEEHEDQQLYFCDFPVDPHSPDFLPDSACRAAVLLANQVNAKAIVGNTRSGYTGFQISRYRPHANIFIFTDNRLLLNTLSLVWGVRAFFYDSFVGTNESIRDTTAILQARGMVQPGDVVINSGSMPLGERKKTNMIKITVVE
ncbi:MAG: pyruvate kinase [Bacteroidetes bacterium]|nr:pyruvate kinase [Bacteroidota bacterium]